ncbi:hypothetical protein K8I31_11700 [bacterium]|nr:hypothetical protein [bacterium]
MVRRIRYSMLAVFIVALSAVITYSSTRWQQPAPPKNDLERLGLNGPVKSVAYAHDGNRIVQYMFNKNGYVAEEILFKNNQKVDSIYYTYTDDGELDTVSGSAINGVYSDFRMASEGDALYRNPLFLEMPLDEMATIKGNYQVKIKSPQYCDQYGNWQSRGIQLIDANAKGAYLTNCAYEWTQYQFVEYESEQPYFGNFPSIPSKFQSLLEKTASESIDFVSVP